MIELMASPLCNLQSEELTDIQINSCQEHTLQDSSQITLKSEVYLKKNFILKNEILLLNNMQKIKTFLALLGDKGKMGAKKLHMVAHGCGPRRRHTNNTSESGIRKVRALQALQNQCSCKAVSL